MNSHNTSQSLGKRHCAYHERGISMVEIMVALALSLILTLGVSEIYLSNKQSYRLQEAQSRIQENGRFVMEMLADELRVIGYKGCPLASQAAWVNAIIPTPAPFPLFNSALPNPLGPSLTGYEGSGGGWLPNNKTAADPGWPGVPANTLPGTDIINMQFAEPCGGNLQQAVFAGSSNTVSIAATNTCSITPSICNAASCSAGDVLVLADCGQVELFRADAVAIQGGQTVLNTGTITNIFNFFIGSHNIDSEVMLFRLNTYFIQLFNGVPTLYRWERSGGGNTAQPILEGVEDMQILYGVQGSQGGSIDQYATAAIVDNNNLWGFVRSVRIDLLLQSSGLDGSNLAAMTTNPCSGAPLTAAQIMNRRLLKCFSATFNLRNSR